MQKSQETWVRSLGQKDLLEEEMTTNSKSLSWKSHEKRSLVGYSPWGHKELDVTEHEHVQTYDLIYSSFRL